MGVEVPSFQGLPCDVRAHGELAPSPALATVDQAIHRFLGGMGSYPFYVLAPPLGGNAVAVGPGAGMRPCVIEATSPRKLSAASLSAARPEVAAVKATIDREAGRARRKDRHRACPGRDAAVARAGRPRRATRLTVAAACVPVRATLARRAALCVGAAAALAGGAARKVIWTDDGTAAVYRFSRGARAGEQSDGVAIGIALRHVRGVTRCVPGERKARVHPSSGAAEVRVRSLARRGFADVPARAVAVRAARSRIRLV